MSYVLKIDAFIHTLDSFARERAAKEDWGKISAVLGRLAACINRRIVQLAAVKRDRAEEGVREAISILEKCKRMMIDLGPRCPMEVFELKDQIKLLQTKLRVAWSLRPHESPTTPSEQSFLVLKRVLASQEEAEWQKEDPGGQGGIRSALQAQNEALRRVIFILRKQLHEFNRLAGNVYTILDVLADRGTDREWDIASEVSMLEEYAAEADSLWDASRKTMIATENPLSGEELLQDAMKEVRKELVGEPGPEPDSGEEPGPEPDSEGERTVCGAGTGEATSATLSPVTVGARPGPLTDGKSPARETRTRKRKRTEKTEEGTRMKKVEGAGTKEMEGMKTKKLKSTGGMNGS